jgi:hypothetical protein
MTAADWSDAGPTLALAHFCAFAIKHLASHFDIERSI